MISMTHTDGYRIGMDHLRAYIAREGHANVPRKHVTDDGFKLGVWVNSRRSDRTVGRLLTARIAELDALGMVWGIHNAKYRIGVDHLRAYIAQEGHAGVPNSHVTDDGFPLGGWVSNRREDRTVGRLSTVKTAELNALGMVWDSHDADYRIGVDHLRAYIAREGHANVHRKFVTDNGFTLGVWVDTRRNDRKIGRLSMTRIAELNALGMVWDPLDANYRTGVDHLRAYAAAQGHANVPATHVADDGFKLGAWVVRRRKDSRAGRLSTAKVGQLNALGMVWDPLDVDYLIGVEHLRAYATEKGHANVHARHVAGDGFKLGAWVANRRKDSRVGRVSTVRITELNALGMVWGSSRNAGYRAGVDHLRVYIAREGHANVPNSHMTDDGFKLGMWVSQRRQNHKVGRLSTARFAELSALGVVWDPHEVGYRLGVDHLLAYTAVQGHADVPARHVTGDGFTLGTWVRSRRRDRTVGRLSPAKAAELNALGMVWVPFDAGYQTGVAHLRAYTAVQDHAKVPRSYVTDDGFKLGVWVSSRRSDRREGTLSAERVAELNALGMVWVSLDVDYQIGVGHLRAYAALWGHASVAHKYVTDDGFTLGAWVHQRRRERRAGTLSTARIAELNALGMVWDPLDAGYRTGVNHLRTYITQEGHINVPRKFLTNNGFRLGNWVGFRRSERRAGRLSAAKITELDALGMVWGPLDAGYRSGVDHLRSYAATADHANVPFEYIADDGFKLGGWVSRRRHERTIGRLSTARIAELDTLGMVWGSLDAGYQTGVDHLRAYTGMFGHANTPRGFVTDDGFRLGVWVGNHRRQRNAGTLSAERVTELDALGMVWGIHDANYRSGVNHLRSYAAAQGHINVPTRYVSDDGFRLGGWVSNRRHESKVGRLSSAKIAELSALGMVWDTRGRAA